MRCAKLPTFSFVGSVGKIGGPNRKALELLLQRPRCVVVVARPLGRHNEGACAVQCGCYRRYSSWGVVDWQRGKVSELEPCWPRSWLAAVECSFASHIISRKHSNNKHYYYLRHMNLSHSEPADSGRGVEKESLQRRVTASASTSAAQRQKASPKGSGAVRYFISGREQRLRGGLAELRASPLLIVITCKPATYPLLFRILPADTWTSSCFVSKPGSLREAASGANAQHRSFTAQKLLIAPASTWSKCSQSPP